MSRTWLITGSSRGFGLELARAALENGDRVLATARRPEKSGQLADLLAKFGDDAGTAAIEEMEEDDFRAQIEANFFGVVNVTRAALPVLRRLPGGQVRGGGLLRGVGQRGARVRGQGRAWARSTGCGKADFPTAA